MQLMILITVFWCIISSLYVSRTSAQDCPADRDKSWSYDPHFSNGPSHWSDKYPNCKGKSQSPIRIVTKDVSNEEGLQRLELNGYDTPLTKVKIENNGHTIAITPRDGVKRSLELDDVYYNLEGFHFHWGNLTTKGSEHEINGRKYVMEGHFVHRNDKGEIAVVGVSFKGTNKKTGLLDGILSVKDKYLYKDETFEGTLKKIDLEKFVRNRYRVHRYNGSLTTPPCTENVTWLMSIPLKYVENSQMEQLYSLYSVKRGTDNKEKCHLINNYRPIQPLNGREVFS